MKKVLAYVILIVGSARVVAAEPPTNVRIIIDAAKKSGLLAASDFSSKTLTSEELTSLEKEIPQQDWIAEIPGLEATLVANFPAEVGLHKSSGFTLAVYYTGEKIVLLSCSVPLVNGGKKEQKAMIETMLATTEALVGRNTGVRSWLGKEWRHAWELSAKLFDKQPIDRKELIRKKKFGEFLVIVWGVVPDIVILNCVREANFEGSDSPQRETRPR